MNLNTATKEELLLIPGMGDRMVPEFKEYRPYKDVAQFPREIGKYVNAREVARLERYVCSRVMSHFSAARPFSSLEFASAPQKVARIKWLGKKRMNVECRLLPFE